MSDNTVQRLRVTGKLRSTELGGVHYYRYADIERLMDEVQYVGVKNSLLLLPL